MQNIEITWIQIIMPLGILLLIFIIIALIRRKDKE